MALPRVSGTTQRGGKYHLNLPIPVRLRPEYKNLAALRRTLATSDKAEAERQVRVQRAEFDLKLNRMKTQEDRAKLVAALPAEDRAILNEVGGYEGLLEELRQLRNQAAFLLAAKPTEAEIEGRGPPRINPEDLEEVDTSRPQRLGRRMKAVQAQAAVDMIAGEMRRLSPVAGTLGIDTITDAPTFIDIGGKGIRALAETFAKAKSWPVQSAEQLKYTTRRWIEFHGDTPLERLTREHLAQFDDALKGLPVARKFQKVPMRAALAAPEGDPISFKTRERLITHLKALSAFALNKGMIAVDPWAGYQMDRPKEKAAVKHARRVVGFTPAEVKRILDHVAVTADADTVDYWLPMLSAYCGARREELGQLRIEDISVTGNIPSMYITDDSTEQKVKNDHSRRRIPIPSTCVDRGFLEFVERRRQAGGVMLFLEDFTDKRKNTTRREMTPDPRGRLTEGFGTRFSRKVLEPLSRL